MTENGFRQMMEQLFEEIGFRNLETETKSRLMDLAAETIVNNLLSELRGLLGEADSAYAQQLVDQEQLDELEQFLSDRKISLKEMMSVEIGRYRDLLVEAGKIVRSSS